jgi:FAD-dependent urate hydroxylase
MMKALIIGGGIAGSVTAVALRRAGLDAVVHEGYDRGADGVGSFLTFQVNGMAALRTLGLDEAVRDLGVVTTGMTMVTGAGRELGHFAMADRSDGTRCRTIRRAELYAALRGAAAEHGVPTEYGKRLTGVRRTGTGITAEFADGTTATGDLLIGADGIGSRVRTLLDPNAPAARYQGLINAGGFCRGVAVPGEVGVMRMIFGKRCFFAYLPAPDGEVWWFANLGRPVEPTRAELTRTSPETWRAELLDLVAGDAGPAADLVRATTEFSAGWPTHDFPTVPVWHDDRMVIIGDAAHAMSPAAGQGASQAIEDAVVLAMCLRDEVTPERAFATYQRLRRERVEKVVAQGKRNGARKAPGPIGRVLRDHVILPLAFRMPAADLDWMLEHRIDWDAPVTAVS